MTQSFADLADLYDQTTVADLYVILVMQRAELDETRSYEIKQVIVERRAGSADREAGPDNEERGFDWLG